MIHSSRCRRIPGERGLSLRTTYNARMSSTTRQSLIASTRETVGQQNMMQLIQLRWIAVFGQIVTIAYVGLVYEIELPLLPMSGVVGFLIVLNLFSLFRPRKHGEVSNGGLTRGLLLDVCALTALLYLSGGATNPFAFLYLLQITLAAVMLETWATCVLVVVTGCCFAALTRYYLPLELQSSDPDALFQLHVLGMLICFVLDAALVVIFMTRINRILRRRDARLADLRQRAAEEDHIVRMGLLASGAAHELGTPLATVSVILGDWKRMPVFASDPDLLQEIDDMQVEVQRCKTILTGILLSAGEARGESPSVTTLAGFFDELVDEWRNTRPVIDMRYEFDPDNELRDDLPVVSDPALKKVICNVLDNALEVSPNWIGLEITRSYDDQLCLVVRDRGPGFPSWMIPQIGKPYQSTKGRPGGGLGLFLVVNVARKFGGSVAAENLIGGGASVTLKLPLAALAIEEGA